MRNKRRQAHNNTAKFHQHDFSLLFDGARPAFSTVSWIFSEHIMASILQTDNNVEQTSQQRVAQNGLPPDARYREGEDYLAKNSD